MVDRSPLTGFAERFARASERGAGRLSLAENPLWQKLNLRINPADRNLLTDALGGALPSAANTMTRTPTALIAWLGPDEWLVLSPDAHPDLEAELRTAAGSAPRSVVDVSAARTMVTIGGTAARDVLAHGCALDLDAPHFPPGSCAQTRLALADVVLMAPPDQDDFAESPRLHILVRSSFAPYLATWLLDAATEYLLDESRRPVR